MGYLTALDLATIEGIKLEDALEIHLKSNHYPSVPSMMIGPCVDAIRAIHEGDYEKEIELPDKVTWQGKNTMSASDVADALHLDAWITYSEDGQ